MQSDCYADICSLYHQIKNQTETISWLLDKHEQQNSQAK